MLPVTPNPASSAQTPILPSCLPACPARTPSPSPHDRRPGVIPNAQSQVQTPRRLQADAPLAGGYFRVHLHPKRFPAAHTTAWGPRIIADTPNYTVVNKPPGVQVPPTVDNIQESLLACTEQVRGRGCLPACVAASERCRCCADCVLMVLRWC